MYYATFQCGRYSVFKKIRNKFFDPEKVKKPHSKVVHSRPPTFFFSTGPAAQTAQKPKYRTTKSPLMQDWVFRLGNEPLLWLHLERNQFFVKSQSAILNFCHLTSIFFSITIL